MSFLTQPDQAEAAALPDEEILRCAREKPQWFGILVDRYQASFLRTANRILNNPEESEDACQEALVKIYAKAHLFRKQPGIEAKSWMYKVLVNTALIRYRKLKRRMGVVSYNDAVRYEETPDNNPAHAPEQYAVANEQKLLIERVIADMPEELGAMLRKYYLEDKPYQTIAAEERMTIGAVKMKLFRARKLFKQFVSGSL